jgi:hypothetical protein
VPLKTLGFGYARAESAKVGKKTDFGVFGFGLWSNRQNAKVLA